MTTNDSITDDTFFDTNKKKKSKNRIKRDALTETTNSIDNVAGDGTTNDAAVVESDYTYEYLITRVFKTINETTGTSPDPSDKIRLILPPVQVGRIGTKRTAFLNFASICALLKRQEKQLHDYFVVELGTTASIDRNHALIIKGRFQQTHIENILRSFIKEYVFCKTCRSPDTLLGKADRLTVIKCNTCHSQYSVSSIRPNIQTHNG
ncbi:unnamed protein product [Rotaria sordida]|uniref:Eukaryotic translation initiation factor 2 subunit 2 n=1 Tax=Rotaria sordida TaxID=392033 RepID=A0A813XJC0_9BILA|nr:unnamed protein product [Rotaria sordida]CAF1096006.1 unnamed protein product [Rotaria sordida]CAF1098375.1 unnamed protein product [Rotaria sordida]